MQDFYQLARICNKERLEENYKEKNNPKYKAITEYSMFEIWCRINEKQVNEESFNQYAKEQPGLDFWLKKLIFEMFFNYKFTFNYDTEKWKAEKCN